MYMHIDSDENWIRKDALLAYAEGWTTTSGCVPLLREASPMEKSLSALNHVSTTCMLQRYKVVLLYLICDHMPIKHHGDPITNRSM